MDIGPTPETGAISADQAVGLLGSLRSAEPVERDEPVAAPEPAEETEPAESEGLTEPEEAAEPEEVTDEPDEESEDAELPPIDAPKSWSADAKAKFEALPRDVQEIVLARETDRDKAVQRSVQEAGDAKKEAEQARQEAQAVTGIKAALEHILPVAQRVFANKWRDWNPQTQAELARTDPATYVALDAQFKAETAEMARLDAVNQQTQRVAYEQFVRDESAKLATLAPDLADPKEGPARRQALGAYLANEGVPQDQIPNLDANTIRLAWKAMRYDEIQAKAATAAKVPRTPPARTQPPLRPAAATPAPSRQRSADSALERVSKTGSTDDAVRALQALRTRRG